MAILLITLAVLVVLFIFNPWAFVLFGLGFFRR